jgi:hypothetical protein
MAAQSTTEVAEGTLAIQETAKLRKVLRRSDLVLFTGSLKGDGGPTCLTAPIWRCPGREAVTDSR